MTTSPPSAAPHTAERTLLRADELVKVYGRTRAVDGLSLRIPRGSIYGFVGPNGAGKTTTLRMLAALLPPDSGRIWIAGRSLAADLAAGRAMIGYMPDVFGVYDNLTVTEYLTFYAAANGVPAAQSRRTIPDLLELVDLTAKRDALVEGLSRGMKQRLGLARCLVHDPQLLLLDEPASGMDPRARFELREILRELQRMGKTMVVSSHILLELAEMCTHVAILQHGRLLREGSVAAVLAPARGAYNVRVGTLDNERAAPLLASQSGVVEVVPAPDGLEVTLEGDERAVAGLVRALVAADIAVVHVARATNPLEEVFMDLTAEGAP
jgi:ABC-2 type transport system ATP-binding protein